MVRFTEGVQDLVLCLTEHDSVHDVKIKVRPAHPFVICTPFQLQGTSDSRRTPPAASPPLAPHTRWSPAHRQHATGVVAQHARGAPAARRHKRQRRRRLVDSTKCARSKLGILAAALLCRPATLRGRGGRRCSGPGTPTPLPISISLLTKLVERVAVGPPCTRKHKLSPCAALIASPLQASLMRTSSTSGDSSTRAPSQTTSPPPSSPPKKNVRLCLPFFSHSVFRLH